MTDQIPKAYEARLVEEKWYRFWTEKGFFEPDVQSEQPTYSIVLPPPNVTGSLHMGHALNITLQDILIRWRRMKGWNVLWVPGTDHAGIATQNVVERQLASQNIHRHDLGRERFEEIVWEWKEHSEQNILNQMRKLGCSCDWSRTRFTLDEGLSRAVREVFVQLYESNLIYRGEYLVNWCPRCSTAISDLEVEHRPGTGTLWYLKYPFEDGSGHAVVATTRPETMLGDTAVAVHPEDERYASLHGKRVILPLLDRPLPIITDTFVDAEFGTGMVKITPGHDPNDFEAGRRHDLPIVKVIGENGRMTAEARHYQGLDRFEARTRVIEDLEALGLVEKVESHSLSLGYCQRCDTPVEPLVSRQWFVRVKPLAEPAIEAVQTGRTRFIPENYQRVYFEWMTNIHDWCISRQLWWGHRIPAWTCEQCEEMLVAREAPQRCEKCGSHSFEQESDVLDTWFSSALWPFSTLGWPEQTSELKTYYPTSTLVTGFDIIFFWVARMMMMGLRFMGDVPFREVHINGLVRDEQGQKMSKSRGNVIDPLAIIDEYGADAIRFTLSVMAVPGTDIPFSISRMAGYKAFCNKIWNAGRFILLNLQRNDPVADSEIEQLYEEGRLELEDLWILSELQIIVRNTEENLEKFRFHEASNELYHFFWDKFCSWYIELIKNNLTGEDEEKRRKTATVALYLLDSSLRLLHPFIPFVTEELWQRLPHTGETLMLAPFPAARPEWIRSSDTGRMEQLQGLISAMRTTRTENKLDPRKRLAVELLSNPDSRDFLQSQQHHLKSLAYLDQLDFVEAFSPGGIKVQGLAAAGEFAFLLDDVIDVAAERERIEKQITRLREDVRNLEAKLSNEAFISRAPDQVVEGVRKRHQEATESLQKLGAQLDGLS